MNNSKLKNTMMSYKQLSLILTILLLLFTFSFACSPAINPTDNNVEVTVFTPSRHIKVSDGSTDITDSLSITVYNSNLIRITGLSNTIAAANKTYTLTIAPVADLFSIDGNDITITDPDGFLPGEGELSPDKNFTITNVNDESNPIDYTLEVPFSGAPVEDWLTSDSLFTYITATFSSQEASLILNENTLSVNDLLNDDRGTGTIKFELPKGFVAKPESIDLPDPDGPRIGDATIFPSSDTFTISDIGNTDNSQEYTINTISLLAITAFTPFRHITITDDSIADPTLNDITSTLSIDVNNANLITITGLSNTIGVDKAYTLTIAPVADLFSTQGDSPVTIAIREPLGFSPGPGVSPSNSSFIITNDNDLSTPFFNTVEVPIVGAAINEWLTADTFSSYFTGASYAGQTLGSGALSFNFDEDSDEDSIAIDGSSIINLQDGSLQLSTTNIADGYTLTQNLSDPDKNRLAALTDADAGSITITEDNIPTNTKTYTVTISLAAYTSPVEASHITAMFNGNTASPSDIEISGTNIIIRGFPNIADFAGSGSVSITQPTSEYIVSLLVPATLPFNFTDPAGTDSEELRVGTFSVTRAGVTALHTIIIRFSTLIELKITSPYVVDSPLTISSGATVTLTGLGTCVLLPPPDFVIDGNTFATVRGFPSYFDRRIDSPSGLAPYAPYTVNRVLKIEDATGVLDDYFTVSIEGFPTCDDASLLSGSGDDAANAYEIDTAAKLELVSYLVENNNSVYATKFYKLTDDIDLGLAGLPWSEEASGTTGEGFPPIGITDTITFQGTFDCAGNSISNLYINIPNGEDIGLFGYGSGASIQNCSLINVNVTGNDDVGGLAGYLQSSSSITKSYVTGSVSGGGRVGGLVGNLDSSSIENSYATGFVSGTGINVGGLVGRLYSSSGITNSYWDTETSGQARSAGPAIGRLTTQLQSGIAGVGIFTAWSPTIWKFDPDTQYPRLILVACPNRQYPADLSNVPTDCTDL